MTNRDQEAPLAAAAAQVLADQAPDLQRTLEDRAAPIAALEQALRARARRRSIRRPMLAVTLATTAVAAAAFVNWLSPRPHVTDLSSVAHQMSRPASPPALASVESAQAVVTLAGVTRDLAAGDQVPAGARLGVRPGGKLSLTLTTGTRIGLGGGTSMGVADLGSLCRFDLAEGQLSAQVAKLAAGHRFVVATPDAEVEVRGTRFAVVVSPTPSLCVPGSRTGVAVEEGVVTVRFGANQVRVGAGHHWPDCSVAAADPLPAAGLARERPRARRRGARSSSPVAIGANRSPSSSPSSASSSTSSSTLAEQNDLLAAALAAERRGDVDQAQRWLDRLLTRYPDGQLAGSARAERRRLSELRDRKVPVP
jgi:hypothetical protein